MRFLLSAALIKKTQPSCFVNFSSSGGETPSRRKEIFPSLISFTLLPENVLTEKNKRYYIRPAF
jgi:hypothetical protein